MSDDKVKEEKDESLDGLEHDSEGEQSGSREKRIAEKLKAAVQSGDETLKKKVEENETPALTSDMQTVVSSSFPDDFDDPFEGLEEEASIPIDFNESEAEALEKEEPKATEKATKSEEVASDSDADEPESADSEDPQEDKEPAEEGEEVQEAEAPETSEDPEVSEKTDVQEESDDSDNAEDVATAAPLVASEEEAKAEKKKKKKSKEAKKSEDSDEADNAEKSDESEASEEEDKDEKKKSDKKQKKSDKKSGKKKKGDIHYVDPRSAKSAASKWAADEEMTFTKEPREGDVIGGIFTPNKPYEPPRELDESERTVDPTRTSGGVWFAAFFVVLIAGCVTVFLYARSPQDIEDVFTGQFKAKQVAERERIAEQHRLEELKKMNKFGTLIIQGNPQYATIKFNGEQRYGLTPSGEWRALVLKGNVPIKNLNIKDPIKIEISSPGFSPIIEEVTEGTWKKNPSGEDYQRLIGATLAPSSEVDKMEFDQRLSQDPDHEFFGSVTINSTPPGAYVKFDGQPLRNAEGKELRTPVTFTANYVFNDETKQYEERKVKVDTVLDIGHKIEVGIEYPNECKEGQTACVNDDGCCPAGPKCNVATDTDCKAPVLVDSLQRQNWTCTFDEEKKNKALEDIKEGKATRAALQEACNYTFTLNADLEGIKKFARQQEEERLRVLRYNAEIMGEDPSSADSDEGSSEAKK